MFCGANTGQPAAHLSSAVNEPGTAAAPTSFWGSLQLARHSSAATAASSEQPSVHMLPPQLQRSPKVGSCMLVSYACGYIWVLICCSLAFPYMRAFSMNQRRTLLSLLWLCCLACAVSALKHCRHCANCLPGFSLRCCPDGTKLAFPACMAEYIIKLLAACSHQAWDTGLLVPCRPRPQDRLLRCRQVAMHRRHRPILMSISKSMMCLQVKTVQLQPG